MVQSGVPLLAGSQIRCADPRYRARCPPTHPVGPHALTPANRHMATSKVCQFLATAASIGASMRVIWLINKASYLKVMQQVSFCALSPSSRPRLSSQLRLLANPRARRSARSGSCPSSCSRSATRSYPSACGMRGCGTLVSASVLECEGAVQWPYRVCMYHSCGLAWL